MSVALLLKDAIELDCLLPLLLPCLRHWRQTAAVANDSVLAVLVGSCLLELGIVLKYCAIEAHQVVIKVLLGCGAMA